MHIDRGIVRTYRRSDGLSTRTDDQNTLTRQSANKNDVPRESLHGPVTSNPARKRPYSMLRLRLRLQLRLCLRHQSVTITTSTVPLRQEPTHSCIGYPTLARSLVSTVLWWQPFPTGFDSPVFDLMRLTCFSIWLDSPVFRVDSTYLFSIWLDSIVFRFD